MPTAVMLRCGEEGPCCPFSDKHQLDSQHLELKLPGGAISGQLTADSETCRLVTCNLCSGGQIYNLVGHENTLGDLTHPYCDGVICGRNSSGPAEDGTNYTNGNLDYGCSCLASMMRSSCARQPDETWQIHRVATGLCPCGLNPRVVNRSSRRSLYNALCNTPCSPSRAINSASRWHTTNIDPSTTFWAHNTGSWLWGVQNGLAFSIETLDWS